MRKSAILFLLCCIAPLLFPQAREGDDFTGRFTGYRRALSSSEGEAASLDFLKAELLRLGVPAAERDFSGLSGGHSFSRIIEIKIQGADPSTLIVAAPVGGRDGGFNSALALALLAENRGRPPIGLHFLFLGGDVDKDSPWGSRLFLQDFFPEAPTAVLYLHLEKPAEVVFQTGARGVVSPSWMLKRILLSAARTQLRFRILGNRNQTYRFGLADPDSPAKEYLMAGYPTVTAENGRKDPGGIDEEVWGRDFSLFFQNLLRENERGFPEEWDRHYLFFHAGKRYLMLEEPQIITLLLIVFGLSFLYALVFRRYMIRYLKTFVRNFWNLPIFLLVNAVFLFAGTLLTRGIALLRGTPDLAAASPFLFFLVKISFAAFLSALTFHNLRRLPISKNGSFYSAAAIFFLFINVVLFSVFNLSYGYYFLWAYIVAILFSIFKNRLVKFLLIFAAPLWLYVVTYDTFTLPEPELAEILIGSPIKGNLILAFVVLPFFLMLIRMDLLFRHPIKGRSGFGLKIFIALFGLLSFGLLARALAFDPYKLEPQPVHVSEYIDPGSGIHRLSLSSPSPLGGLELRFGRTAFPELPAERRITLDLESAPKLFERTIRSESFLDRRTYTIRVAPGLKTRRISFTLRSEEPLVVYDANFPYSPDISGRKAEIHIGENPPSPLDVVLTFPGRLVVSGEILFVSRSLSEEAVLSGRPLRIITSSSIRDSIILKADE